MTWNLNMDEAPKGQVITGTKVRKDEKMVNSTVRHEDWLWLVTETGAVIKGHWSPTRKHWAGVATDQKVIAWQHFVKPEWP